MSQTHIKMTWEVFEKLMNGLQAGQSDHFYWLDTWAVSYTHLTLPTILRV